MARPPALRNDHMQCSGTWQSFIEASGSHRPGKARADATEVAAGLRWLGSGHGSRLARCAPSTVCELRRGANPVGACSTTQACRHHCQGHHCQGHHCQGRHWRAAARVRSSCKRWRCFWSVSIIRWADSWRASLPAWGSPAGMRLRKRSMASSIDLIESSRCLS